MLIRATEPNYELIVIDNDSPDDTGEWLSESVSGARIVANDDNVGFGSACNQGASMARGRLLLFLNPDVLVEPGWLDPLIAAIDASLRTVAAGPLLLNIDGSLQIAGALIDGSGATACYGIGDDDADRPEYRYQRSVDYLAGACLMVERTAFDDVGGFDASYNPAYFEDADLCLELSARGGDVVLVPRSRVRHVGDVSGGSTTLRTVAEHHRDLFAHRWSDLLASRPSHPIEGSPRRLLAARDARATIRVLVLSRDVEGLDMLLRHCPHAAVAVIGSEQSDNRLEVIPPNVIWSGWLHDRRFHYDLIVGAPDDLEELLDETQPQAVRSRVLDSESLSAVGVP
jgi:GT2 family glycosyltransferase